MTTTLTTTTDKTVKRFKKRKKAASVREMLDTNFKLLDFEGDWLKLIGKPELKGWWIIWGESFNGKTEFALQLAKYLCNFRKVGYNSVEQGISNSMKQALIRQNMIECNRRFILIDKESIEEIEERLDKRKSPDIIFFDTVQYTELEKRTAKKLSDKYPRKLFIAVSHAEGKNPEGRPAMSIKRLSDVKIRVEGFRAKVESRNGGDIRFNYTIWHEGAKEYWGDVD